MAALLPAVLALLKWSPCYKHEEGQHVMWAALRRPIEWIPTGLIYTACRLHLGYQIDLYMTKNGTRRTRYKRTMIEELGCSFGAVRAARDFDAFVMSPIDARRVLILPVAIIVNRSIITVNWHNEYEKQCAAEYIKMLQKLGVEFINVSC